MKKSIISVLTVFSVFLMTNVCFAVNTTKISVSDEKITVDGITISEDLQDSVYLTNKMDNGGTSTEAKNANIDVDNVVNITKAGTYEFSGTLSDGQIAVNTNGVSGDIVILLNNVNITCKNAPAIFVYNVKTDAPDCNVIIKTAKDSDNYISGGLIKQSVEGWPDQEKLLYSVEKSYNDKGEYFERYKYDGAISADISLTFEGEGRLTIASQREGIEVKRDITINSGDYVINSTEDGMNAAQDNESVITINGGTVLVNTSTDADGIDSNGYLYVNGGEVYAFSSSDSMDSGLDSDLGIYINGGKIIAIGNMYDEIKEDSKQKSLTLQFDKGISAGSLIIVTDDSDKPVMAFESDRDYKVMTFSDKELKGSNYKAYEGGSVTGTNVNGLYTDITSYTLGTEISAQVLTGSSRPFGNGRDFRSGGSVNVVLVVVMGVLFVASLASAIVLIVMKKGNVVSLILGVLAGVFATVMVFSLLNGRQPQMPDNFRGGKPDNMMEFGGGNEPPVPKM